MWEALLRVRVLGKIEDEINFLNSWHSSMLVTAEDYNARYRKYGIHIDQSQMPTRERTLKGPSNPNRIVLARLWELKEGKRNLETVLIIVTGLAAICAVVLFMLGL
jgi:hypothetical protein